MKIPKKIVDHTPTEPVYEFDVVTFKKTDRARGSKKGYVGTIVDMVNHEKHGYTVETPTGDTASFHRHEFRLATKDDLARFHASMKKKKANMAAKEASMKPPEMPNDIKGE